MKSILVILVLAVSFPGFSQNIKLDDNIVYVDGKEYVKYEGGGGFDNSMTINSLEGEELVFVQVINPGEHSHRKVVFVGLDNKVLEMSTSHYTRKKFIKYLYNTKVIVDGKLDPKKVDIFISKYDEKLTKDNDTTTIIIKEESQKSGININIGN